MRRVREQDVKGIVEHFEELPDPRETVNRLHLLVDVIVLSICGVLAGADVEAAVCEQDGQHLTSFDSPPRVRQNARRLHWRRLK